MYSENPLIRFAWHEYLGTHLSCVQDLLRKALPICSGQMKMTVPTVFPQKRPFSTNLNPLYAYASLLAVLVSNGSGT